MKKFFKFRLLRKKSRPKLHEYSLRQLIEMHEAAKKATIPAVPPKEFYVLGELPNELVPQASNDHDEGVVYIGPNGGKYILHDKGDNKVIIKEEPVAEPNAGTSLTPPLIASEIAAQLTTESKPQPPVNAEFILHLLLRRDEQDAVIGDLLERYPKKCERLGERRAQFWFYGEIVRSIWPLIKRAFAKITGLVVLGEWIRRHIS